MKIFPLSASVICDVIFNALGLLSLQMGQELGYVSEGDKLIITTDDESVPIVDLPSLVDECKNARQVQIQNVPKGLLQVS